MNVRISHLGLGAMALCILIVSPVLGDAGKAKRQYSAGVGVLEASKTEAPPVGPMPRNGHDDCAMAMPIDCNTTVLDDNSNANPNIDPTDPPFTCHWQGPPPLPGVHTLWYSFVATDTSARITSIGTASLQPPTPFVDSTIEVYSGTCGNLVPVPNGCGEDEVGGGLFLSELCATGLTVGETYLIQFGNPGGWAGWSPGPFQFDIDCPCPALPPPPNNDNCQMADPLTLVGGTVTVTGQTISAAPDNALDCDAFGNPEAPGVWYTVSGTGNTMTASSCLNTDYDAKIFVYCGTDCFDLVCVANDDDDGCVVAAGPAEASWCSTAGQTYWIFMHGSGNATGNFELTVSDDGVSCNDPPPCVPQGACCIPMGADPINNPECTACEILTEADCLLVIAGLPLGQYIGDGTGCGNSCQLVDCPVCCDAANNQCSLEAPSQCNGTVLANTFSCDTAPCDTGACCTENGCQENVALSACQAVNGAFLGGGSVCGNVICNDFCQAALTIQPNSFVIADNTNATQLDPTDPLVECYFGSPQIAFGSLWYKFVATDTSARLHTENSLPPADDSQISLYSVIPNDPCNSLLLLGCSEDEGTGFLSDLCVDTLITGNTYYVMLTAFSVPTLGPYQLDLQIPCPCDAFVQCCVGDANEDGQMDGSDVVAFVEAVVNPPADCTAEVCKFDPNLDGLVNIDDVPGFVSLMLLGPDCGADNCIAAVPIADGVTPFSTLGATTDGPTHPLSGCDALLGDDGAIVNDIWYRYTASCTGTVRIETCNNGGATPGNADFDTRIALYDGTNCANLNLLACNDDGPGCAGFSSDLMGSVVAGTTYLVRIGGFPGGSGTGQVSITCMP